MTNEEIPGELMHDDGLYKKNHQQEPHIILRTSMSKPLSIHQNERIRERRYRVNDVFSS